MKLLALSVLLFGAVFGQDCGQYEDQGCCEAVEACKWENDMCLCSSLKPIDLIFVLDESGSMFGGPWQTVTGWLEYIVPQITTDARIAFVLFDHDVRPNTHSAPPHDFDPVPLSYWTDAPGGCCNKAQQVANLEAYIDGVLEQITPGGGTNIAVGVSRAMDYFEDAANQAPGREKFMVLVTDGQGGQPCGEKPRLEAANVRPIIVGIGAGYGGDAECLLQSQDDLYLVPNYQNIDEINADFLTTLCEGDGPPQTTTKDPLDKCEEGCYPYDGPCMHLNLGDYTCHQYNAFGECPQGTFDCGTNRKCMEPCYLNTYGDCMSKSMGDFTCWPKLYGSCPAGTLDCSGMNNYPAKKLKQEIDENLKNEQAFEESITKDIRLMILIIGVAFIAGFACVIAVLSYQCSKKDKAKHLGFTKVISTDPDTESTVQSAA